MESYKISNLGRNHFLDLTKAIAIILVVFGHCIQYGSGHHFFREGLYFDNFIFKTIYSFHMPLFMLISGYLFASGINKKATDVITNKFTSLIIPIFTWAMIPLAIYSINTFKDNLPIINIIKYYIHYCIYSLWFLWAVFFCSIIVIINNRFFKDNIFVYIFLFIISFITPDSYNLNLYKFMYPFFLIGYFYRKHNLQQQFHKIYKSNSFVFTSTILFFIMLIFFEKDTYIYVSGHTTIGKDFIKQIHIDLYRYFIGIIGSITTLSLLYKIYNFTTYGKKNNNNSIILTIGKSTMGIYIISSLLNIYILKEWTRAITSPNYLINTIESIVIIVTSVLIIKFIKKYNKPSKYLLGFKNPLN